MKFLIVENELIARRELERKIGSVRPDWEYIGYSETISDTIRLLNECEVDLIFMDIDLDDGECFEIFKHVSTDASIIFTTAYSEYAVRAFKLNSLDYLLKPYSPDDLLAAIEKFERLRKIPLKLDEDSSYCEGSLQRKVNVPRILIQEGERYSFVDVGRVAWLESEDKYVFGVLDDGSKKMVCFKSLKEAADSLSATDFFRVRRNVIVSAGAIREVNKFFKGRLMIRVGVKNKELDIIVNASLKSAFLAWLGMH